MNELLVSIIIPCYNCSEWLERLINSFEKQTNLNFEIIFINDGSTDDSLEKATLLFNNSNLNYKIIDVPNGGVSKARNIGLQYARGKYIYFLDADDFVSEKLIETISKYQNQKMIIFGWQFLYQNNKKELAKNSQYVILKPNIEVFSSYLKGNLDIILCGFVVERELIKQKKISFEDGVCYGEDSEFIMKCIFNSDKIQLSNEVIFNYCIRNDSAMGTYSEKRLHSINAAYRVKEYISSQTTDKRWIYLSKKYVAKKLIDNIHMYASFSREISSKISNLMINQFNSFKIYVPYILKEEALFSVSGIKKIIQTVLIILNIKLYIKLIRAHSRT